MPWFSFIVLMRVIPAAERDSSKAGMSVSTSLHPTLELAYGGPKTIVQLLRHVLIPRSPTYIITSPALQRPEFWLNRECQGLHHSSSVPG
jgi:hypothetical protein